MIFLRIKCLTKIAPCLAACFLIATIFVVSFAPAAEGVRENNRFTIVGTIIPGLFEEGSSHYYNQVYDKLIADYDIPVSLNMAHINRAGRIFSTGDADCLFVGSPVPEQYSEFGLSDEDMLFSQPVNIIKIKAYRAKGLPPVISLEQLAHDTVAFDAGIGDFTPVTEKLPITTKILHAPTLKLGFRMLDIGRVNILLAVDVDVENLQSQAPDYENYSVSPDFTVFETEDVFVCKKSERTTGFLQVINRGITQMNKE